MAFLDYFRNKHKVKNNTISINQDKKSPSFSDENLGLSWNRITSDNLNENELYFDEMEAWSTDVGIRRYIASRVPIDQIFRGCVASDISTLKNKNNLYFCFNDNSDFIGLAYITAPMGENNHSTLEYLIVNPSFQNSGLGTKMIKSITNNIEYFNDGYECSGIVSSVEQDNMASSRAFLKINIRFFMLRLAILADVIMCFISLIDRVLLRKMLWWVKLVGSLW